MSVLARPALGKLAGLLTRAISDFGGAFMAPLITIGDRLGLYRTLAVAGPLTATELATLTGTFGPYIHEWLNAHAASGYLNYSSQSDRYELTDEQAMLFADPDSPAFVVGGFQAAMAAGRIVDRLTNAFCSGEGISWHEHDHGVPTGWGSLQRVGYLNHLLQDWIPALDGVQSKLEAGIDVADVGCGAGHATLIMAKAFPKSTFVGIDSSIESIASAIEITRHTHITNVSFQVAQAHNCSGSNYEFVTTFNALHYMGDPVAASRHVFQTLAPNATWMIVEPYAGDQVEENLNPIGRVHYASSTLFSIPHSLNENGRMGLGAQAGEARIREVVMSGGFGHCRRVSQTPWHLCLEAGNRDRNPGLRGTPST